jgi:hypothetical protein
MDTDEIGQARERAQAAASRARLADDPEMKRAWQELADAWLAVLAELQGRQRGKRPRLVRDDAR